jgi:integrase
MSDDFTPNPEPRKAPAEARQPKAPRVRKTWTVAGFRIKKPYLDFPLSPHATGTWQKKIRGRIFYFGRWARVINGQLTRVEGDGWKEALEQYQAVADDLHAGRTPRVNWDALTVAELCNRFLTVKLGQLETGEIGKRSFAEYKATTDRMVRIFGRTRPVADLAADDFEKLRGALAQQYGPVRLGNEIQRVRSVFKFAFDGGLIDRPVRFGGQFKKPSAGVMRRHRAKNGEKMLEPDQLRRLMGAASVQLRAMLLLGINCGFGNHDVATLPLSAVDLDAAWMNYPRPKTGIPRRCPLWPETVEALREAIARRPDPQHKDAAALVFVTVRGGPWFSAGTGSQVSVAARKLMKAAGVYRDGIGFYSLRHTFRTIADATRDPVAIDLIMGHTDPGMGARYRERIEDTRLLAVAEYVRRWLFGAGPGGGATEPADAPAEDADPPRRDAGSDRPRLRLFAG